MDAVKENKHIVIVTTDVMKHRKTKVYAIFNKKEEYMIGSVMWNPTWRQYCFYPEPDCIWSTSCLDTVVEFVKKINEDHKKKKL